MTDSFIPGYDAVPEPEHRASVAPFAEPEPLGAVNPDPQVFPVASEADGYKAPRAITRDAIRERIRKVRPYTSVTVDVEEWDVTVEVRSMTLGDRNEMGVQMAKSGDDGDDSFRNFYPMVLIACAFDLEGNHIFTHEDLAWINSLDANIVDKIAKPAMDLNGFGKEAEKVVEEAAGKSSETETSESSSS